MYPVVKHWGNYDGGHYTAYCRNTSGISMVIAQLKKFKKVMLYQGIHIIL